MKHNLNLLPPNFSIFISPRVSSFFQFQPPSLHTHNFFFGSRYSHFLFFGVSKIFHFFRLELLLFVLDPEPTSDSDQINLSPNGIHFSLRSSVFSSGHGWVNSKSRIVFIRNLNFFYVGFGSWSVITWGSCYCLRLVNLTFFDIFVPIWVLQLVFIKRHCRSPIIVGSVFPLLTEMIGEGGSITKNQFLN